MAKANRKDTDAEGQTDVSGSGSAGGVAGGVAGSVSGAAGTGAAGASDLASSYTRTEDVGSGERYSVESADRSSAWAGNVKRTYDLHQTWDYDALNDKRKHQAKLDSMELAEREQRLTHQAKVSSIEIHEREQSRRHYEDMHTLRFFSGAGFIADTVQEAFAERVAEKVCTKIKSNK